MSSILSRASALVLALGGLSLLFAPDVVLPRLGAGAAPGSLWLAQLLAAALLALASLDWLQRTHLLGGIYGRPTVFANATFYFIGATSVGRATVAAARDATPARWGVALVLTAFAIAYGWLLFRGPTERDLGMHRAQDARAT